MGDSPERKAELNRAAIKQQYAVTALIMMTMINILLGVLMVIGFLSIWSGMLISFGVMLLILMKANRDLLEEGETLWESPRDFHTRRNKNG